MEREELQAEIDELMRQYQDGEIDGETYAQAMMDLTSGAGYTGLATTAMSAS